LTYLSAHRSVVVSFLDSYSRIPELESWFEYQLHLLWNFMGVSHYLQENAGMVS